MKSLKFLTTLLAVAGLLTSITTVAATKNQSPEISKKVQENTDKVLNEKRRAILSEATVALQETHTALRALDSGKKKDALQSLERATGKLELILARDPKLALAPAEVGMITQGVLGDADTIKKIRKQAEDALEDGRLQEARHLISNLGSEIVVSVTNLPLASYPLAIKRTVKFIDENKLDEARQTLSIALSTLVVTNAVIPLPVVASEELLMEAEKLSEKKDRTADENKRLSDLLTNVRSELKLAQEFGYGTKKDFKSLYDQLSEIEKKTEGGKSPAGIFSKIKASISDLINSSQKNENKDSGKVRSG